MAKPLPLVSSDDLPTPTTEEARRDRVYKAISNHINEITAKYVKAAVDRYRARLDAMSAEERAALLKGPPEKLNLNLRLGKDVLAGITEIVFTAAMQDGYFRFPDGYGSFRVQRLTSDPKPKRLPTGDIIQMPSNRVKFKYEDGAAIREALGLSRKTNYIRRYKRESRLSEKTRHLLTEDTE